MNLHHIYNGKNSFMHKIPAGGRHTWKRAESVKNVIEKGSKCYCCLLL